VADEALVGAVLDGRYKIIAPIAQGAMGTVYRGERLQLGRAVAIKVLHEKLPTEMSARSRFQIEAKAMAQLDHPHCVPVFDVGVHEGKPYIVMELVRGKNLKDVIADGRLPRVRALAIVRQVLSGLSHAHELGIIHRDIKPPNIVVSHKEGIGEVVRILDFGLARYGHSTASSLTKGFAVGTPAYMAPEQCSGRSISPRTDLYAVGVVLFELLVGRRPFEAEDPLEMVRMHLTRTPPRLGDIVDEDFGALEGFVARSLAKDPDARFADANAMAQALEAIELPQPGARRGTELAAERTSIPLGNEDIIESAPVQHPTTMPGFAPPPVASNRTPGAGVAAVNEPKEPTPPPRPRTASAPPRPPSPRVTAEPSVAVPVSSSGRRVVLVLVLVGFVGATFATVLASGLFGPSNKSQQQPVPTDPTSTIASEAEQQIQQGKSDAAIQALIPARKQYRDSAPLAYQLGRAYFAKLEWRDGLAAYRDAIRLDPSRYRDDAAMIRDVIRAFVTTPDFAPLATFLHDDVGKAAAPFLDETARNHPSAKIRARATAELARYH
jgi:eukaryotic-like serine/threonine-protein kinase